MGPGKLISAALFVLGADFRLGTKDSAAEPIPFDHEASLRECYYWMKTDDWPCPGPYRDQGIKVKGLVKILVQAEQFAERSQYLRMEIIKRALGGS